MKSAFPIFLCIIYCFLLLGYSCFHAGHALLHTLQIHSHHHEAHHHIGDHTHFFSNWFESGHDEENKKLTIEVFPAFIFAQAFEDISFSNRFILLPGYFPFVEERFQNIGVTPPTPPPIV
jgi:hypothetical protein